MIFYILKIFVKKKKIILLGLYKFHVTDKVETIKCHLFGHKYGDYVAYYIEQI